MILVSGGTGLVGSYILLQLTGTEKEIRAIYRNERNIQKCKHIFDVFKKSEKFSRISWVKADLQDYYSLQDVFDGVEYVYHAAAQVSFAAGLFDSMLATNQQGTANMVNLALSQNIKKFCYVSSVAALGIYESGKCTDEEALWQKTNTTSDYSISKYYAENEVWRASEEGLNVVIVNPSTIIGYGDWNSSSLAIVKRVFNGLKFYPAGGNGFVGVEDVATCCLKLMNSDVENERFVLVSENLKFKNLFDLLANGLQKKEPTIAVSKWMAKLFANLLGFVSLLSKNKKVVTTQSVETAYKTRCYSNQKIRMELDFSFMPMQEVAEKYCKMFLDKIDKNSAK